MNMKTIAGLFVAFLFVASVQVNANSIANEVVSAAPSNDDCANATDLTVNTNFLCGATTSGTLAGATASTAPSGCSGTDPALPNFKAGDDVWFKFVATDVSHKITLSVTGGSPTDLYLMGYDGGVSADCGTMSAIFCSDPEISTMTGLTVGNTYFLRVFSNSTSAGATTNFDVCVGTAPTLISNDDCSDVETITSLPFDRSYDATSATNTGGFVTATGCDPLNDGVWFSVLGDGGDISITVRPTSWNAGIGVYTGTCAALTCVATKNIGGNSVVEALTFSSTLGVTYLINIAHPSGTVDGPEGVFELSLSTSTLSIDKLVLKGFKYYPNPVNDILKMSADEAIDEVTIYSILGKQMRQVRQGELTTEVDLSSLTPGTYFVKAVVGNSSGTFKILKN